MYRLNLFTRTLPVVALAALSLGGCTLDHTAGGIPEADWTDFRFAHHESEENIARGTFVIRGAIEDEGYYVDRFKPIKPGDAPAFRYGARSLYGKHGCLTFQFKGLVEENGRLARGAVEFIGGDGAYEVARGTSSYLLDLPEQSSQLQLKVTGVNIGAPHHVGHSH